MLNSLKDYMFLAAIILLIALNIFSIYYITSNNNAITEKITNINKEYNKKINEDMARTKSEYDGRINSIFSEYSSLNSKKKDIAPTIVSKVSETKVSKTKIKQPQGNKELSDALISNGYPNSIMFCYTSSK